MSGSSGEYVTAAPIADRAKIPVISTGGTPDSAIYPAHAYQYEAIPTAYQSALAQIQVAHILAKENNISNPRVAITGPSVPYVADFSRAVHDLASKYGYTVVSDALNSLTATDFTADAAKIDSARPNIIVGSQTEQFTPVVMSALAADGVKVPLVNFFGSDSPALYDKLQTPDYYAMRFAAFPTDPSLSDMQVAAQRDNVAQYEVRQFFTAGWIAAATTATALRKCGWPCSGTKMNASLEKISKLNLSPYVYGSITLNAKRHYFVSSMQPFHWVSGNIVAYGRPVDVSGQPPEAYVNQVNGASA
jgi:ABC-type branched-subunit amino acid transport system substrate-binding protein